MSHSKQNSSVVTFNIAWLWVVCDAMKGTPASCLGLGAIRTDFARHEDSPSPSALDKPASNFDIDTSWTEVAYRLSSSILLTTENGAGVITISH